MNMINFLPSPRMVKMDPSPPTAEALAGFFNNKKRASLAAEQKLFPFKAIYFLLKKSILKYRHFCSKMQ
jgi:hypothetical protein